MPAPILVTTANNDFLGDITMSISSLRGGAALVFLAATLPASAASLYWTEQAGGSINTPSTNTVQMGSTTGSGSPAAVYTTTPGGANGIEAIGGQLYIPEQQRGTVTRFDADGSNAVDLVTGVNPYDVDVEGAWLYWTELNSNAVMRKNADGSGLASLAFSATQPFALDVTASNAFYSEFSSGLLRRAELDGSGAITLVSGQEIRDLEVVGSVVYFIGQNTSNFQTAIQRINTDGTGLQTILGGLFILGTGLDVTADSIFFSDLNGAISRIDLNGANGQQLYTGPFGGTRGVAALDIPQVPLPGTAWLMLTGIVGVAARARRRGRA
jgi:hypothetical protein